MRLLPRRGRSFFSTNRVCSRCLALKDTVVGHTDESGVTIPPLHPRCRCAIMYREVGVPRVMQPKPEPTINPAITAPLVTPSTEPTKPDSKPDKPTEPEPLNIEQEKVTIMIAEIGEAQIPMAKLTKYALNPAKAPDKALAFEKALGYNLSNVDKLIENVVQNINRFKPERRPKTEHGEPFQIVMELTGENGKTAKVTTGWIIDVETGEVRLTSIYVKKK